MTSTFGSRLGIWGWVGIGIGLTGYWMCDEQQCLKPKKELWIWLYYHFQWRCGTVEFAHLVVRNPASNFSSRVKLKQLMYSFFKVTKTLLDMAITVTSASQRDSRLYSTSHLPNLKPKSTGQMEDYLTSLPHVRFTSSQSPTWSGKLALR